MKHDNILKSAIVKKEAIVHSTTEEVDKSQKSMAREACHDGLSLHTCWSGPLTRTASLQLSCPLPSCSTEHEDFYTAWGAIKLTCLYRSQLHASKLLKKVSVITTHMHICACIQFFHAFRNQAFKKPHFTKPYQQTS